METEQRNRTTMFKTVRAYLDDNNSVWSGMAPLQTAVTQFKNKIGAIDVAAQKQETPTGATVDKGAARDALEDVLFLTCEALGVLGHSSNDHDLTALTAVRPSTLQRFDDEALSNRATSVLAEANARKTELATLQVTQANLDELDQALQAFNAGKVNPRTATAARMVQTESLPGLIREASGILRNEIDRLVNLFRRSDPDFVAGYRAARVIVDRAASRTTTKTAGGVPTPNA
ncbi:MAG: hypothetical protein H7Z16_11395 [Pyrinomonadaceae bacterium]|nr:hypothetical protein [Pyrinomonadaceae bacterium]